MFPNHNLSTSRPREPAPCLQAPSACVQRLEADEFLVTGISSSWFPLNVSSVSASAQAADCWQRRGAEPLGSTQKKLQTEGSRWQQEDWLVAFEARRASFSWCAVSKARASLSPSLVSQVICGTLTCGDTNSLDKFPEVLLPWRLAVMEWCVSVSKKPSKHSLVEQQECSGSGGKEMEDSCLYLIYLYFIFIT